MARILFVLIGYLFGMIQSAYIVGRFYKIDMREHGSKNLGTTNALRTLGAKAGAIVFALDVIKPIVAVIVTALLYSLTGHFFGETVVLRDARVLYTGFGVMLGHNYPFYLGFKGGKGVACTIGTLIIFQPTMALLLFVIGVSIAIVSKYISLASMMSCAIAIPLAYAVGYRGETFYMMIVIASFIVFKHRGNIKRLINGNENKFTIKKKAV